MKRLFVYVLILVLVISLIGYLSIRPSNDKDWNDDQIVISHADINDNLITVYDVRNISYNSTGEFEVNHYNRTYDLDKLEKVYFIVEPFEGFIGAAHTFVSFEFEDDVFVSVSVEIRREKGEEFSAWRGLLRQYELIYVVGDENDLIKLRTNYRRDDVYMYLVKTDYKKEMFLEMINRVNDLYETPEFYNSFTNSCTTNLVKHVNKISKNRVPFSYKVLLPEYSAKLAYDLGLISNDLSFEETQNNSIINDKALSCGDCTNFSLVIRS